MQQKFASAGDLSWNFHLWVKDLVRKGGPYIFEHDKDLNENMQEI